MSLFRVVTFVLLLLVPSIAIHAKDWHGITPLHSTSADVQKILGPAWHDFPTGHSIFLVDGAPVEIVFAVRSVGGERCSGNVLPGTVLSIYVTPKRETPLTDLEIDPTRSKVFSFEGLDYRAYYDQRSGLLVSVLNGKLETLWYLANASDRHLCSEYYHNPKHFAEIRIDDF